jgi:hypothetical protein
MKNIAHALIVIFALTGVASSQIFSDPAQSPTTVSKMSAFPKPMCPPGDPNGCGIGGIR